MSLKSAVTLLFDRPSLVDMVPEHVTSDQRPRGSMPLSITPLAIPEVKLVVPDRFGDDRGFFSETYNRRAFAAAGLTEDFVQDNHSLSATPGTVRGLHYQLPPFAQGK